MSNNNFSDVGDMLTQTRTFTDTLTDPEAIRARLGSVATWLDEYKKPIERHSLLYNYENRIHAAIIGEVLTVGRSSRSNLVIPVPFLSGVHFQVELLKTGEVVAADCDSKNGILVNGETAKRVTLVSGDLISAGSLDFMYICPVESYS